MFTSCFALSIIWLGDYVVAGDWVINLNEDYRVSNQYVDNLYVEDATIETMEVENMNVEKEIVTNQKVENQEVENQTVENQTKPTELAHKHEHKSVVTNPTCTANGYTDHTCYECGHIHKSDFTDKLPEPTEPEVVLAIKCEKTIRYG